MKPLTRQKEIYNLLTRSQAYKDTGRVDNSRINKNKFTPHNPRALFIEGDGVMFCYYTTIGLNQKLLSYQPLNQQKTVQQIEKEIAEGKAPQQDTSTFVDVLTKQGHLRFSNLEEIYLFTGGFKTEQEYQQELTALNGFLADIATLEKSFKRLHRVVLVDAELTNDFTNWNPNVDFVKQFEKAGIPHQVQKRKIERDEWGLPQSFVLDNGEYKLDAPFDPKDDKTKNSEETRLARWYYSQKVKAKKRAEEKKKQEEQEKQNKEEENKEAKLLYAKQLKRQGFKIIGDKQEVAGNIRLHTKVMDWLKGFFTEKEYTTMGYRYRANMINQDVLEDNGEQDVKSTDIWHPNVYRKDEDLQFRVFVKEDNISFTILIKLPLGLNDFSFKDTTAINNIAIMFSKLTGKDTYQASIMQQPRYCALKSTRGVDCSYDCVEIVLAKDLMAFKNSNWSLIDYIKACKGEANDYTNLKGLSLGSRVVTGVKPGGLKAEIFDCSGKYNVSGMIGGQAGSGKTALFDSLLVQFLALQGDFGDGAVVLLDAKQEWIPAWRNVFNTLNIPFYGFDGGLLRDQSSLKQQGKNGAQGFKGQLTQEVAGIIFMREMYDIIQSIQKNSCQAEDIKDFNRANVNYQGITRLPRIALLVDEINTLHNFTKDDPIIKSAFNLMTSGANLTRTSGYMWLLGGQNPSKSVIPSKDVGSLGYNLFGTMSDEIYDYFGVKQNKDVVNYEKTHGTADTPNPIMSQGMFYAGKRDKTELVKCLYVDKSERLEALELIGEQVRKGMEQFDKIVKYALDNHLFDNYTYGVGVKNNLVYAALRDIGIITDQEFENHSERLFPTQKEEEPEEIEVIDIPNLDDKEGWEGTVGGRKEQLNQQSQYQQQTQNNLRPTRPPHLQPNKNQPNTNLRQTNQPTQNIKILKPKLEVKNNPIKTHGYKSWIGKAKGFDNLNKLIIEQIKEVYGGLDKIDTLRVDINHRLILNNEVYAPTLDEDFLDTLPLVSRGKVEANSIVEFFDFYNVYKMSNLQSFIVEDIFIVNGQARKQLNLKPSQKYSKLLDKLSNLQYINIAGVDYQRNTADFSNGEEHPWGWMDKIKNRFGKGKAYTAVKEQKTNRVVEKPRPSILPNIARGIWDSKPMRVATNALGWTVGVKAVMLASTLLGPWGLLFGAIASYGAIKELLPNKPKKQSKPKQQAKTRQKRRPRQQGNPHYNTRGYNAYNDYRDYRDYR